MARTGARPVVPAPIVYTLMPMERASSAAAPGLSTPALCTPSVSSSTMRDVAGESLSRSTASPSASPMAVPSSARSRTMSRLRAAAARFS